MTHATKFGVALALLAGLASAGAPGAARPQEPDCRRRTMLVNVVDRDGFPVAGLGAENFRATFRGKQVQVQSARVNSRPTRIVILLDASGSMRGEGPTFAKWKLASGIAARLVSTVPAETKIALLMFSEKAYVAGFSGKREEILAHLRSIQSKSAIETLVHGSTALYSAIFEGVKLFGAGEPGDAMLVITDGWDNVSKNRAQDVETLLASSGVKLFAILLRFESFRGPSGRGPRQLVGLVAVTGGSFLTVEPKRGRQISFELNSEADQELKERLQRLYGVMAEHYRIEIELPENADKPREWKLDLVPGPGLNPKDYRLAYPQKLLPCGATATK